MIEKTWDGRGDKLTDARLSFLSGRVADDLRLSGLHFRLLAHVGRQNHRRGWLRLSQSELATQWEVSRQRVNMAIKDLVTWQYVTKRGQVQTGESFCTYKVRLDDPEDLSDGVSPVGDTQSERHLAEGCHVEATLGVSPTGDTSVTSGMTPVSPCKDTLPITTPIFADSPPLPLTSGQAVGGGGKSAKRKVQWIEDLRNEGHPHHVVDELLGRLAETLRPWKDLDPIGCGRQVCLDLRHEPLAVVDAIRERVLSEFKYRLPPIAKLREIAGECRVAHARDEAEAQRTRRLDDVRVEPEASREFLAALGSIASPAHIEAWFSPAGVVSVATAEGARDAVITITTPHLPRVVAQHADSLAKAAARVVWGAACEVQFIQGRAA